MPHMKYFVYGWIHTVNAVGDLPLLFDGEGRWGGGRAMKFLTAPVQSGNDIL